MRSPRIAVPKEVIIFFNKKGYMYADKGIDQFIYMPTIHKIKECIEQGIPVPEEYYRKSSGDDFLLQSRELLHLHVGAEVGNDDVLLIVKQLENVVLFICLTTHEVFKDNGAAIQRGLGSKIAKAEVDAKPKKIPPPISEDMQEIIRIILEEVDPKMGDKERMRKVIENYKKKIALLKELDKELGKLRKTAPDAFYHLRDKIQDDIDNMKAYFASYNRFRNIQHDDKLEFLTKEGLDMLTRWFEGWYMSRRTYGAIGPLIQTLEIIKSICPRQDDMILYRIVAVEDAMQAQHLKQMQTGPRSLQSWTITKQAAQNFFRTQYSGGETMIVSDEGHLEFVDKLEQRDYVIVKAKIPGSMILWTPQSVEYLEKYSMHEYDSKLYMQTGMNHFDKKQITYPYTRFPSKFFEKAYDYAHQGEVIVNIPGNQMIPVLKVIPIHVR